MTSPQQLNEQINYRWVTICWYPDGRIYLFHLRYIFWFLLVSLGTVAKDQKSKCFCWMAWNRHPVPRMHPRYFPEFYSALANKILCHLGTVELWSAGDWPVFLAEIRKKSKTKRPGLRHIIYLLERSFWVSFRFYGGLPGLLDRVWLQATGRRVGNDKDWAFFNGVDTWLGLMRIVLWIN